MKPYFRRIICLLCALLALSPAFGAGAQPCLSEEGMEKFTFRELSIFDTEITLIGFAPSREAFDSVCEEVFDALRYLDRVFDAYHGDAEINNLYEVNRLAAEAPVEVPEELFRLIAWCKEMWENGLRSTNIAMGAVLSIWHEYRENGTKEPDSASLPPMEALQEAAAHVSLDDVILDPEKQTVFFSDPALLLDVGAVAKGWAADAVLPLLMERMPSFLLSLGGNVYAGEPPLDGRSAWAVGVQNPRPGEWADRGGAILDIMDVTGLTVVTSGDYWRYYTVDGVKYHHIIDPDTLMPSRQAVSVTVICKSSALADFLSTTLFVLSWEEGLRLTERIEGVEALWVLPDGTVHSTPGIDAYSRYLKPASGGNAP